MFYKYLSSLFFILLTLVIFGTMEELEAQKKEEIPKVKVPDTPSISQHNLKIKGKTLNYTATTGYITLESETGEENAHIFYIAYTKDGVVDPTKRPVTFSFNGGPGSSSVWLHLGVLGPRRVAMTDDGMSLPPPYQLVDNEQTWLEESDLVFIDPVTTGFSRAVEEKKAKNYHGFNGDISSVGHFIRRYVSDNKRWASPKYLIGESYGTTRASALSSHLINNYGMYLNGIILVSAITNFQTARFERGNDLPYALFLPTYAASAYYHKKLAKEYLDLELSEFLNEVENFAMSEYTVALMKGFTLEKEERENIINKLHKYTGLSKTYIDRADLRINIHKFKKELLRTNYEVIGRFDSRYKMIDMNGNGEYAELDPSYQPAVLGTFGTLINDYLGRELNFSSKLPYNILTGRVHPWDYSSFENKYINTSDNLRKAMLMNPHMKVWIANGYYDLATPYFATEYTMNHLQLEKKLFDNIWMTYYPAGHMMYLLKESLIQMKEEASKFYKDSQNK